MPTAGDRFGRYALEAPLGQGAMGRVFRAFDSDLKRYVAIKVLLDDTSTGTEGKARLLREARAAAQLDHPHAVHVFDVGESDGVPYLVMELIDGEPLRARVARGATQGDVLRWLAEIAEALAAAHAIGLVHRDVKPDNVMIRRDGRAKVLDFGIARRTHGDAEALATLTGEGVVVGTPAYMAPEQLRGLPIDGRADQFSFGVMAYECLTGALPWGPLTDAASLVGAILLTEVRRVPGQLPAGVEALVLQALAKDREARFPTMVELRQALVAATPITSGGLPAPLLSDALGSAPTEVAASVDPRTSRSPMRKTALFALLVAVTGAGLLARQLWKPADPSASSPGAGASASASTRAFSQRTLAGRPLRYSAISPDGSTSFGYEGDDLVVTQLAGGAERRVNVGAANRKPEELYLAALGRDSILYGIRGAPRTQRLDGQRDEAWPQPALDTTVTASLDGRWFMYLDRDGLNVVPIAGGAPTLVTRLADTDAVHAAAWSPDSTEIAYVAGRGVCGEDEAWIEIVSVDGSRSRRIVRETRLRSTGCTAALAWTAGLGLVYPAQPVRGRPGQQSELRAVQPERGGDAYDVLHRFPDGSLAGLQAAGDRVIALLGETVRELRTVRLTAAFDGLEAPSRTVRADAMAEPIGLFDDGRSAWAVPVGAETAIEIREHDGQRRILTRLPPGRMRGAVMAGPYVVAWDPRCDLVRVSRDGDLRLLLHGAPAPIDCGDLVSCSATAATCVVQHRRGGRAAWHVIDQRKGTVLPSFHVGRDEQRRWSLSADGATLLIAGYGRMMTFVDVKTGKIRELEMKSAADTTMEFGVAFPDGNHFALTSNGPRRTVAIANRDGAVRELEALTELPKEGQWTVWFARPSIAADGRTVGVDTHLYSEKVVLLER